MLDVLRPDYVVALQREEELEPVLRCFRRSRRPRIVRLSIAEAVQERDRWTRSDYRRERFRHYFARARVRRLSIQARGLHGMVPTLDNPEAVRHRLVALCDRHGFACALGIAVRYEAEQQWLYLWAPSFRAREIATLQFGRFRLDPAEVGLGVRPGRLTAGRAMPRMDELMR
ncbi:MAG: Clp1/GlmU family protein [Rhodothermus sp.]|nr:Clp1/GlmU family protein [Rhodothermus sp.]